MGWREEEHLGISFLGPEVISLKTEYVFSKAGR